MNVLNVENQVILKINAGHLPPDDLVRHVLKKVQPNAFGFSVQSVEDGKPDLAISREGAGLEFDNIKTLCTNAKDHDIFVYLAKLPSSYNPDDIQPFVINDGDNNPFISIYLEGDILGTPEEGHTEHYTYANGILIPKIAEWCEDFDGDLDKITAKLTGETFKKEFMMHVGHRAVLGIMPCDGDPIVISKNDLGTEPEDWGWVSMRLGFGDKVAEPVKVEAAAPKKNKFSWGGTGKAASPAAGTSVPVAGVTTDPKTGIHTVTGKDGKPVQDAGSPMTQAPKLAARPPAWCKSNNDVKMWYDICCGIVHPQWKKRPAGTIVDEVAAKIDNLEDFNEYTLRKKLAPKQTSGAAGTPPEATAKADVKAITGAVGDKELPIIGPKDLEKVLEYVAKFIDGNSQVITDPKQMQAIEATLPNFAEAVGLKPEETLNWPFASLIGMGNTDIRALALYAMMWRIIARPHVKASDVKTTVTKSGEGTVKTESIVSTHVLAKEELAPAKKKFSWGKAA